MVAFSRNATVAEWKITPESGCFLLLEHCSLQQCATVCNTQLQCPIPHPSPHLIKLKAFLDDHSCSVWLLVIWCPMLLCICLTRSSTWRASGFKPKSAGLCSGQGPNTLLAFKPASFQIRAILAWSDLLSCFLCPYYLLFILALYYQFPQDPHCLHVSQYTIYFLAIQEANGIFLWNQCSSVLGTGRRWQIRLHIFHCAGKVRTIQCKAAVEWDCQKAK